MAATPFPRTWGASEAVTAAKLNTDIRDALSFYYNPPRAKMRLSASFAVNSAIASPVPWDTEVYDTDGGHSTSVNNTRYVSKTDGWYYVSTCLHMSPSATASETGTREVVLYKNSTEGLKQNRQDAYLLNRFSDTFVLRTAGHVRLAINEYLEVMVYQDSGAVIFVSNNIADPSYFSIRWVRE